MTSPAEAAPEWASAPANCPENAECSSDLDLEPTVSCGPTNLQPSVRVQGKAYGEEGKTVRTFNRAVGAVDVLGRPYTQENPGFKKVKAKPNGGFWVTLSRVRTDPGIAVARVLGSLQTQGFGAGITGFEYRLAIVCVPLLANEVPAGAEWRTVPPKQ